MKTTLFAAALGLAIAPVAAEAQPLPRRFVERDYRVIDRRPDVFRRVPRVCPNRGTGLCRSGRCGICRPPIRDCDRRRGYRPIPRRRCGTIYDRGFDRGFDRFDGNCANGQCDLRPRTFPRGPNVVIPRNTVPRRRGDVDRGDFGRGDVGRGDVDRRGFDRGGVDRGRGPVLEPPVPPRP